MTAPRRVRLALDERRAQLLALGIRLFSNHSYEDISIDEVASQAGISKGLLYHYFPGKREFYVEVIREASLQLRRLVAPDPQLPPAARLRAAVVAHLNYVEQHGAVYRAIYRSGVSISPEVSVILEEHREVALHYLLDDLKVTRPRPALRAALRAWIALVEGASLDFAVHPEVGRELVTELVIAGYTALLTRAAALDPRTARSLEKVLRRGPVAY